MRYTPTNSSEIVSKIVKTDTSLASNAPTLLTLESSPQTPRRTAAAAVAALAAVGDVVSGDVRPPLHHAEQQAVQRRRRRQRLQQRRRRSERQARISAPSLIYHRCHHLSLGSCWHLFCPWLKIQSRFPLLSFSLSFFLLFVYIIILILLGSRRE